MGTLEFYEEFEYYARLVGWALLVHAIVGLNAYVTRFFWGDQKFWYWTIGFLFDEKRSWGLQLTIIGSWVAMWFLLLFIADLNRGWRAF